MRRSTPPPPPPPPSSSNPASKQAPRVGLACPGVVGSAPPFPSLDGMAADPSGLGAAGLGATGAGLGAAGLGASDVVLGAGLGAAGVGFNAAGGGLGTAPAPTSEIGDEFMMVAQASASSGA